MSTSDRPPTSKAPRYWRSLEAFHGDPEVQAQATRELPPNEPELELTPITRRTFLNVMGSSMALGGLGASLTGCRKPVETILPYTRRPEDIVPGTPRYFATSAFIGGSVLGLLVESQDGRPTKIEGNPQHPFSGGAAGCWAQASVLELYSPDRSQKPVKAGGVTADWNWKAPLWDQVDGFLAEHFAAYRKTQGKGLALLIGEVRSPTLRGLLDKFRQAFPQAHLYRHDAAHPEAALAGAALAGVQDALPFPTILDGDIRADVILSLDCDFLDCEGDSVRLAGQFAAGRRVSAPEDKMNRLYAVEPSFTVTGAKADNRLQLRGSEVGAFLAGLASELFGKGLKPAAGGEAVAGKLGKPDERHAKWTTALARDLLDSQGRSLILVGDRQPASVHALAHLLNASLGNVGRTVRMVPWMGPTAGTIGELAAAITGKEVSTLLMMGGNPAYTAPAELDFGKLVKQVPMSIHHSMVRDETSQLVTWHLPASHYLEAWGDLAATDGTTGIQQPLIAPLFDTMSDIEVMARVVGVAGTGYELVRTQWASRGVVDFEGSWRRWLHDGVIPGTAAKPVDAAFSWGALAAAVPASGKGPTDGGIELAFQLDHSVYDGRYAGNAWLQELPDPMTKLTWDNAALLGEKLAERLGVTSRDLVEIGAGGKTLQMAAFTMPGVADDTVVLPLGYGRTAGAKVAAGAGFNTYALRSAAAPHYLAAGVSVKKVSGHYELASTQHYGSLTPTTKEISGVVSAADDQGYEQRPILREATLAEYRGDPDFVEKHEEMKPEEIESLFVEPHAWKQPAAPGTQIPQQWGMSIDLNACIGCSACTIACQAENNIGVVGKERVLGGRELHWIRMDRYFSGTPEAPRVSMQPMPCQQCENAPCETVCPVNATAHSPEGLNDMAYNRCIGTRYCSNNCPYKVRRYNYLDYVERKRRAADTKLAMQRSIRTSPCATAA